MSTLREAAQALCDEIEQDLADGKAFNASTVGAAKALRAELAKPDAPAVRRVEAYTYASTQATNCAGCGEYKHTPLRIDAMDGYVCLTCIDKKLGSLLGEFGYPEPEPAPAEPQPERDFAAEVDHWVKRSKEWRKRAEAAESAVSEFHHAVKDAGWHPGRTDDSLPDIIRAKGAELRAISAQQPAGGSIVDPSRSAKDMRRFTALWRYGSKVLPGESASTRAFDSWLFQLDMLIDSKTHGLPFEGCPPVAPQPAGGVREPVAVIGSAYQILWCRVDWSKGLKVGDYLFAHPPTAKPLTDERIDRILDALPEGCCNQITGAEARVFARAIEASITATKGEP